MALHPIKCAALLDYILIDFFFDEIFSLSNNFFFISNQIISTLIASNINQNNFLCVNCILIGGYASKLSICTFLMPCIGVCACTVHTVHTVCRIYRHLVICTHFEVLKRMSHSLSSNPKKASLKIQNRSNHIYILQSTHFILPLLFALFQHIVDESIILFK